jgi:hypothetical protein
MCILLDIICSCLIILIELFYKCHQAELHELEKSMFTFAKLNLSWILLIYSIRQIYAINVVNDLIELVTRLVLKVRNELKFLAI